MGNSKSFLTLAAASALLLCTLGAHAQESRSLVMQDSKPDVWLNAGMLSYHFDRDKHYREFNYGLGAEAIFSPNHAAIVGTYKNSESHQSHYLGYEYRPFHWQPAGLEVSAGVAVSLIDGYPMENNTGWFIAPFPVLNVEGKQFGANFILIPNIKHGGALAMQLKMKVW
ncbi:MAG: hypothetical protein JO035_00225 [Betaproteobacteria bacterium]|nr:hypothetical protein [Betaproteobacteria bacterium]